MPEQNIELRLSFDAPVEKVNALIDTSYYKGDAATIAVGTVATGAAGSDATVVNSGTKNNAVFDFVIPRGDRGENGEMSRADFCAGEKWSNPNIIDHAAAADSAISASTSVTKDITDSSSAVATTSFVSLLAEHMVPVGYCFEWSPVGRTFHGTKTEISTDGTVWTAVYDSSVSGEYVELPEGKSLPGGSARYIRDRCAGNSLDACDMWTRLEAFSAGVNVALDKSVTSNITFTGGSPGAVTGSAAGVNYGADVSGGGYITVDLGEVYALDYIRVLHCFSSTDSPVDLSSAQKVHDYFGFGRWAACGMGRTAVGVDEYSAGFGGAGACGGSQTHYHTLPVAVDNNNSGDFGQWQVWDGFSAAGATGDKVDATASFTSANHLALTGAATPGNFTGKFFNSFAASGMPPYIVVYRWVRTA
jgi:hypothetical protein